jgi:hypothetical protein
MLLELSLFPQIGKMDLSASDDDLYHCLWLVDWLFWIFQEGGETTPSASKRNPCTHANSHYIDQARRRERALEIQMPSRISERLLRLQNIQALCPSLNKAFLQATA